MRNLSEVGTRFFKASSPKSNNWGVCTLKRTSQNLKKKKCKYNFLYTKDYIYNHIIRLHKDYYTRRIVLQVDTKRK